QGGIISPLLANIALDGMERLFGAERPDGRQVTPCLRRGANRGINLRHFPNGKLLVRPQKEKVALHRRRLSAFFRTNRQMPTAEVIKQLSPVIRGWCNYFRYAVAKRTFANLDHHVWQVTYKWAKRRHPRKNRRWVVNHYYGVDQGRGLGDGRNRLPRHNETR